VIEFSRRSISWMLENEVRLMISPKAASIDIGFQLLILFLEAFKKDMLRNFNSSGRVVIALFEMSSLLLLLERRQINQYF